MLIFDIIKLCQCFERHLNVLDLPIDERVPKSSNVGSTGSAISGWDPVRGWNEKKNTVLIEHGHVCSRLIVGPCFEPENMTHAKPVHVTLWDLPFCFT